MAGSHRGLARQLQIAWERLGDLSFVGSLTAALSDLEFDLSEASSSMLSGAGATVGSFIDSTVGLVSGLFLALVLMYYLLKDGNSLSVRLASRASSSRWSPGHLAFRCRSPWAS